LRKGLTVLIILALERREGLPLFHSWEERGIGRYLLLDREAPFSVQLIGEKGRLLHLHAGKENQATTLFGAGGDESFFHSSRGKRKKRGPS